MKKAVLIIITVILFFSAAAFAEEVPIVCELREDLNFNSPVRVVYLKLDMKERTVNGIPSTVMGKDIITYETQKELLTIILPSMYITVKHKDMEGLDQHVDYTGVCYEDRLKF